MSDKTTPTVVVAETPEKSSVLVLTPKQKKIAKIVAATAVAGALVVVGYKLRDKDVLETASEAVSAAADVVSDNTNS